MIVTLAKRYKSVEVMVSAGANINARSTRGLKVLDLAVSSGCHEIVRHLLNAVKFDPISRSYRRLLSEAINQGYKEVEDLLMHYNIRMR
jgi:ankyrin repeat protein